jgi:uncharacterized damage-inducible protein DinB
MPHAPLLRPSNLPSGPLGRGDGCGDLDQGRVAGPEAPRAGARSIEREGTMAQKRRKGAVGAMMDEYERAAAELMELIRGLSEEEFERVRDRKTQDDGCRSIQTVARHVVSAGYAYATDIRRAFGADAKRPEVPLGTRLETLDRFRAMLEHTASTLDGKWESSDQEITAVKMHTPWGVDYDLEQMLEHAIVHVLRHRRQIERFLTEPQFAGTEGK